MMKVEPPSRFFWLACAEETGEYLRDERPEDSDELLSTGDRGDDAACWELVEDGGCLLQPVSGLVLTVCPCSRPGGSRPGERGRCVTLIGPDGSALGSDGAAQAGQGGKGGQGAVFTLVRGPAALPSASLGELREHGWTTLPALHPPGSVAHMKRAFDEMQTAPDFASGAGDRVSLDGIINHTPCAVHATVHPTVLWLVEEYLGFAVHLATSPICAIAKPQQPDEGGVWSGEKGGWHSVRQRCPPFPPPSPPCRFALD